MKVSRRGLALIGGLAAASIVVVGSTASAARPFEALPGWGYGDNNHIHVGPPGASVRIDKSDHHIVIRVGSIRIELF